MAVATCVECDEDISIGGRPRLGQKVVCGNCGARLEVVNTSPMEVDWAYEEDDDDWDDDYDENEAVADDDFDDELDDSDEIDDDDEGSWR